MASNNNNNNDSSSPTSPTFTPPTLPSPHLSPAPTQTILDIWEAERTTASAPRPLLPPPPSTRTRTRTRRNRINTALTTATAHATHHTALNTAYLSLRALEAWALQHCACPSTTLSSSSSPSCSCSSPSCLSCNPASAHHGPDDHAALIAHSLRRGMADGAMWDWDDEDEDEDEDDGQGQGAAKKWFRALAVAAARLADGGELARLGAGVRRAVRAVVRAEEGVRRVDRSSGSGGLSRGEREAVGAMRRGWWVDGDDEEEVVKVREQAEMMRVPVAYTVAVGGLEGWVRGMEKRYKSLLRLVRGVYAEIGRRDGHVLAQSVADALGGPTVLVVGRLICALGWTQADLDAGASTINSATSQGRPGSPWQQLIITSIPHIGRLLRDVDIAAFKLSRPTNADGSRIDAAPVLARLRQALDRYLAWTMANFDRIHVQLCARLAEMQADPIYYNDALHATVRSAFKTTTGMFVSPRLKQFLPLGVHQAEFASALQKLEPHRATLPARLRADYNIMWTVHFLYNLGIDAAQKRAQCDKSLALVLPDALHLHRESALRTATARWEKLDAKFAETLDAAVESAEQHDAHSIAARDVLAALRDGESLERAAELATFGNLVGPGGRCVVELLECAIEWRDKADAAKAHARRVERFHAMWTRPKRTVQMAFRPH